MTIRKTSVFLFKFIIVSNTSFQIESAIDELKKAEMIISLSIRPNYGIMYSLTEQGKKYLAGNTMK